MRHSRPRKTAPQVRRGTVQNESNWAGTAQRPRPAPVRCVPGVVPVAWLKVWTKALVVAHPHACPASVTAASGMDALSHAVDSLHCRLATPASDALALEGAGLECIDVYGIYTDGILKQPLDVSTHTKAIYIARSPG